MHAKCGPRSTFLAIFDSLVFSDVLAVGLGRYGIGSGQLINGEDAHHCAVPTSFRGELGHVRCLGHELGAIVLNQPQAVRVPHTWRDQPVQQRLQAAIRVVPVQAASAVPCYLQRASANRCRGRVAANRRQHTGAPAIAQFFVDMEMHALDGIVGRSWLGQMEFVDEFAWGH